MTGDYRANGESRLTW